MPILNSCRNTLCAESTARVKETFARETVPIEATRLITQINPWLFQAVRNSRRKIVRGQKPKGGGPAGRLQIFTGWLVVVNKKVRIVNGNAKAYISCLAKRSNHSTKSISSAMSSWRRWWVSTAFTMHKSSSIYNYNLQDVSQCMRLRAEHEKDWTSCNHGHWAKLKQQVVYIPDLGDPRLARRLPKA